MTPWKIFITGSLLLTLVLVGGLLLSRDSNSIDLEGPKTIQGARLLVITLWLASLSVMAYIAFVFGKR